MHTPFMKSALAALIVIVSVVGAQAWERKTIFSGPRGDSSVTASGDCSSRSCSHEVTRTGAAGRTATRSDERGCADGTCSGARSTTGPAGRTVNRNTTLTR